MLSRASANAMLTLVSRETAVMIDPAVFGAALPARLKPQLLATKAGARKNGLKDR